MMRALLLTGFLFPSLTVPCWLLAAALTIHTLKD